jgi:hypothetical protein
MSLLPKILPQSQADREAKFERELLALEADLGGTLFGQVPKGHRRQFFCLDEHTWIWHEEWKTGNQRHAVTTRYDVRPTGILKTQDGKPYQRLSDDEARNLYRATDLYRQRVGAEYQRMLQPQAA